MKDHQSNEYKNWETGSKEFVTSITTKACIYIVVAVALLAFVKM